MSKYKIVNLFDKVFVTTSIFLIIFAWINFFIRDLIYTFFLSLFFSAAVVFLIFYFFNKRTTKRADTKKYLRDIDEKFLAFRLMSKSNQLNLINSILKNEFTTRIINNYIVCKKNNIKLLTIVATEFEKITEHDFINIIQGKTNVNKIEIICNEFDHNINTKILTGIDIEFTPKKKLYDTYFFKYSIYPDCDLLNKSKSSPTLKIILKNFFIPSKAKSYFLCGLILIFSSIILPFHYYYLIFGSALLICAIICKLTPVFKH